MVSYSVYTAQCVMTMVRMWEEGGTRTKGRVRGRGGDGRDIACSDREKMDVKT